MDITLEPGSATLPLDTVTELPSNAPSTFSGILLLYGDGMGNCSVKVSGSFTLAGVTYTCTDLALPFGTSGIGLNMPGAVDTSTGGIPVVRIIFDLDGAVLATTDASAASNPNMVALPDHPDVWLGIGTVIFVPYVGTTEPTVRKYAIELKDPDYNPSQWYLKLVTYFDGDTLAGAGYSMLSKLNATMLPGIRTSGGSFTPGSLYFPKISKVSDGVWDINYDTYPRGPGSNLRLPAFALSGGDGICKYTVPQTTDPIDLEYSAVEITQ
jgi:hypothetical protein